MSKTVIYEGDFCVRCILDDRSVHGPRSKRVELAEVFTGRLGRAAPGLAWITSDALDIGVLREHMTKAVRLVLEVHEELKVEVGRLVWWEGIREDNCPGQVRAVDHEMGVCAVFAKSGETLIVKLDDIYKVEKA